MALPTILFNSGTGSDTAASGAGPGTALSGANASLGASTTVALAVDAPDLSGVATDGSAVCWVDSTSGRQYSRITAVDNVAKSVTVATAYGVTEATRAWGIGGKRATLDHADSRTLGADVEAGWIVEIEDDGASALTGSAWPITAGVAFTIRGDSISTKRLMTQSANAAALTLSVTATTLDVANLIFENTAGTKTSANGIVVTANNPTIRIRNCRFGHSANTLLSGLNRTAGAPVFILYDCEVMSCTSNGVSSRAGLHVHGSYIHDNAAHGLATGGGGGVNIIQDSVVEANGTDGINVGTTPTTLVISGNAIHGNTGDGLDSSGGAGFIPISGQIYNNNFTANGNYGIRAASGENPAFLDFNNFGTGALANTSGSMLNLTAGANDLAVDPGYTNASGGNFAAGTAIKAKGFPASTQAFGANPAAGTIAFVDIGIQREEPASGGDPFPSQGIQHIGTGVCA